MYNPQILFISSPPREYWTNGDGFHLDSFTVPLHSSNRRQIACC